MRHERQDRLDGFAAERTVRRLALQSPNVVDAAVELVEGNDGARRVLLSIVKRGSVDLEAIRAACEPALQGTPYRLMITAVSSLLRSPTSLDRQVIDDELVTEVTAAATALVSAPVDVRVRPRRKPLERVPVARTHTTPSSAAEKAPATSNVGASLREARPVAASGVTTLPELLSHAARRHGQVPILHLTASQVRETTVSELYQDAIRLARGLHRRGVERGDIVLLQLRDTRDFLAAFWACQLHGCIAAPVPAPAEFADGSFGADRARAAWEALDRPHIFVSAADFDAASAWVANAGGEKQLVCADTDTETDTDGAFDIAEPWPDADAVLLFTSGSTGAPKIVPLRHDAIIAEALGTRAALESSPADVILSWMPLEHGASLAMIHAHALVAGAKQVHAPTHLFAGDPIRWIDAIDRFRVTMSWAPNFAFGLVAGALPITDTSWQPDLSHVRVLLNGGEQVMPRTVEAFRRGLAPFGFRDGVVHAAWGMSETSSGVLYKSMRTTAPAWDEQAAVSVGEPIAGVGVRVVDEQGTVARAGEHGRLQVTGTPIMRGYLDNAQANRSAFTEDGWFDTGDIASFVDGEVHLHGRNNDTVIVNGMNIASPEVEAIVNELEGIDRGYTVVCGVRPHGADSELFVIAAHPLAGTDEHELRDRIRRAIVGTHGIAPHHIVFLERDEIPRTDLGKLQRSRLSRDLAGRLSAARSHAPDQTIPSWVLKDAWVPAPLRSDLHLPHATDSVLLIGPDDALTQFTAQYLRNAGIRTDVLLFGAAGSLTESLRLVSTDAAPAPCILYLAHTDKSTIDPALHQTPASRLLELLTATDTVLAQRGSPSPVTVKVVHTPNLLRTAGVDDVGFAAIQGLVATAAHELSTVRVSCLTLESPHLDELAQQLLDEVLEGSPQTLIRVGANGREAMAVSRVLPAGPELPATPLQNYQHIMVVGGLGGVGCAFVRHLLESTTAHVSVMGRRSWETALAQAPEFATLFEKQSQAGRLSYAQGDASDEISLRDAFRGLDRSAPNPIDIVFYLAGTSTERPLRLLTEDVLSAEIAARMEGARQLTALLADRPHIDVVLFSSAYSRFGAFQRGAYVAATAAMNEFARSHHRAGRKVKSIAWGLWAGLGIAREIPSLERMSELGFPPMPIDDAIRSLEAALSEDSPVLFLGVDPWGLHVRQHLLDVPEPVDTLHLTAPDLAAVERLRTSLHVVDRLGAPVQVDIEVAPNHHDPGEADGVEEQIRKTWQSILATTSIGLDDDFFELGGTSLDLAEVHANVSKTADIEWADMLRARTIRALAAALHGATQSDAQHLIWRGKRVLYRVLGDLTPQTVPLVVIAGAFQDMYALPRLERLLAQDRTIILCDLPGSGEADDIADDESFDYLADALEHLLTAIGVARVDLFGISFGGSVAFVFADRYPAMIRRLILCGTATLLPPSAENGLERAGRALRRGDPAQYVEHVIDTVFAPSALAVDNQHSTRLLVRKTLAEAAPTRAARFLSVQRRLLAQEHIDRSRFRGPTMVFTGEHDTITPVDTVRACAGAFDGAHVDVIPRADHLVPIERPAAVAELVRSFLAAPEQLG